MVVEQKISSNSKISYDSLKENISNCHEVTQTWVASPFVSMYMAGIVAAPLPCI
ncbi:MAG TPA: hypothetical protein VF884_09150 [Nitrososphaeraceae archaeon]